MKNLKPIIIIILFFSMVLIAAGIYTMSKEKLTDNQKQEAKQVPDKEESIETTDELNIETPKEYLQLINQKLVMEDQHTAAIEGDVKNNSNYDLKYFVIKYNAYSSSESERELCIELKKFNENRFKKGDTYHFKAICSGRGSDNIERFELISKEGRIDDSNKSESIIH